MLIGMGRPPAACGWLPAEWPADYFPLGGEPDHCGGWRSFVRSVLDDRRDTIPPDHSQYGWLTLTRATRLLAHNHGLITTERLLAPLPAARDDARREAFPLLDGLVIAGRSRAEPATADTPGRDAPRPSAPTPPQVLAPESVRWLGEALALLGEATTGLADFGERAQMIGSDGAGNPLCVEAPSGAVVLLDHEDRFHTRQYVNSGVGQLAECLLAFTGERDPDRFRAAARAIDPPAMAERSFWWQEAAGLGS